MCDPVTMTTLTVIAGGMSAYSQYQQGRDAEAAAMYNARELENAATRTRNKGVEEENIHRLKVARLKAQQRAQLGAAGVDLNVGSAADLVDDTDLLGNIDALRIRSNFEDQADAQDRQAEMTRFEGKSAKRAGTIGAIGTLLTTGATAGSMNPSWFGGSSAADAAFTGATAGGVGTGVAAKWYTPKSAFFTGGGLAAGLK